MAVLHAWSYGCTLGQPQEGENTQRAFCANQENKYVCSFYDSLNFIPGFPTHTLPILVQQTVRYSKTGISTNFMIIAGADLVFCDF